MRELEVGWLSLADEVVVEKYFHKYFWYYHDCPDGETVLVIEPPTKEAVIARAKELREEKGIVVKVSPKGKAWERNG